MEGIVVEVHLPQGLPASMKMSNREFADDLTFMAAAKYFEIGKMSSGRAAELAGMSKVDFLHKLNEIGCPALILDDEQIDLEIQAALSLAQ